MCILVCVKLDRIFQISIYIYIHPPPPPPPSHTRPRIYTYTYPLPYTHTHIMYSIQYTRAHARTHARTHAHMHARTHARTCTHMYTHATYIVYFLPYCWREGSFTYSLYFSLIFEYPATGGLLPNSHFKTLKLLRYVTTMDTVVFACEVFFLVYLLYYTVEEVIEIQIHRGAYFKDVWNVFDIILIGMGYITVFFIIYVYFEVKSILSELLEKNNEQYANFATLGSWQDNFNQFVAVFVFLAWIKVKYILYIFHMALLIFSVNV